MYLLWCSPLVEWQNSLLHAEVQRPFEAKQPLILLLLRQPANGLLNLWSILHVQVLPPQSFGTDGTHYRHTYGRSKYMNLITKYEL